MSIDFGSLYDLGNVIFALALGLIGATMAAT